MIASGLPKEIILLWSKDKCRTRLRLFNIEQSVQECPDATHKSQTRGQ
jgi:hypothetical protein